MQTIIDVEKAISLNQELLSETKKRIEQTASKLSDAKNNTENIQVEIKNLKEQRQQALAKGGDSKTPNDSLKKLEAQLELESETCKGLEDFLKELRQEESELCLKLDALPKRGLQLTAIEIAGRYNALASQLAPVVRELNEILFKLDASGCGGKHGRVVFLPDGQEFIEKVMRLTYDNEAINLERYIQKNITNTPYEPGDDIKYFYVWGTHRQRLIDQKTE